MGVFQQTLIIAFNFISLSPSMPFAESSNLNMALMSFSCLAFKAFFHSSAEFNNEYLCSLEELV
jgi:hypothetical protein